MAAHDLTAAVHHFGRGSRAPSKDVLKSVRSNQFGSEQMAKLINALRARELTRGPLIFNAVADFSASA